MKKLFKLSLIALLCSLAINAKAQLADVTYTVKLYSNNGIYSCEGCNGLACWETGDEEYTANAWFRDDVNGTATGVTCFTCNNNGDCYYGGGTTLGSRTNGAYRIDPLLQAWEDDGGSRCSFDGGDDCYLGQTDMGDVYFREGAFPSTSTYSSYGWFSSSSHSIAIDVTWKYSGTTNALYPDCRTQSTGYSAGAIRSWSVYMVAGRTYRFGTCGTAEDTYLRIFSGDGYTNTANYDDNGPLCGGTAASGDYTAPSTGWYYLELSRYSRSALTVGGTLTYEDITTPPSPPATFGNGAWYVTAYTGGNIDLTGEYSGYYSESNLTYNSLNRWGN